MIGFFDPGQVAHNPKHFMANGALLPNPEMPERCDILKTGTKQAGWTLEPPSDHGPEPNAAIHTAEYPTFPRTIYARWQRIDGAGKEVIPNIHPANRTDGYPRPAVGQAGYHQADTACPISEDTGDAAYWSAQPALSAARATAQGDIAYALCRPPGHHAFVDLAGGFCFLDNSAIAAEALRKGGMGAGLGANLNLPLPRGTDDKGFLSALDKALDSIASFGADVIVVALGLDAHEDDPFQGRPVTTEGFRTIAGRIAKTGRPLLLVQEGGYVSDALEHNLISFLAGIAEGA